MSLAIAAVACGGGDETPTDTDPPEQMCADPVYYEADFVGRVTDGGAPASGVEVRIEERTWEDGVRGTGTTAGDGTFSLHATNLPIVEGCWGWATDFEVVADDGTRSVDVGINPFVTNGWSAGETTVDLGSVPIDLAGR